MIRRLDKWLEVGVAAIIIVAMLELARYYLGSGIAIIVAFMVLIGLIVLFKKI